MTTRPDLDRASTDQSAGFVVVVVTYGDRWDFLGEVVTEVLKNPVVTDLVVVDNGSRENIADRVTSVHESIASRATLNFVDMGKNRGSAAGFAAGLEFASRLVDQHGLILLLDDDTVPTPGSIGEILVASKAASHEGAFLMNRPAQRNLREACRTGRDIEYPTDSYAGFSLRLTIKQRLVYRYTPSKVAPGANILASSAPYAGLVVRPVHIELAGLPDCRLVLYEDDTEFTLRLTHATGRIRILRDAELRDIDPSWKSTAKTFVKAADVTTPEFRAFYSLRNRRLVERMVQPSMSISVTLNAIIFFGLLAVDFFSQSLYAERRRELRRRFGLIRAALRAGRNDNVGDAEYSLP